MFRFTIRELVVLTALVAIAIAWWLDRASLAAAKAEAVEDARSLTQLIDPRHATNPHFDPLRVMYSRKYPQLTAPPAASTSGVTLPNPQ
jgi:hypothetical protein